MEAVSGKDRDILRRVALKQLQYAQSEKMQQTIKRWKAHNTFQGDGQPMVHIEMDTFEQEIVPDLLRCEGGAARQLEASLYRNFLNVELFEDDFPVVAYFPVHWDVSFLPGSLEIAQHNAQDSVGFSFEPVLQDLSRDIAKLRPCSITVDKAATQKRVDWVNDAIGDILPAKIVGESHFVVPTFLVVGWMGMENMLFSMYDYPEEFHQMMELVCGEYLRLFDFIEQNGLVCPTVGAEKLAQGSWCFTDELPAGPEGLKVKDTWGYLNSQETVGISPEMFHEFVYPYYLKIAERFGLLSYGCCEAVDPFWETSIRHLPNLRKVSISAWCDEEYMGSRLQGTRMIYHRKPAANYIGVGKELDEGAATAHIDKTLRAAKGCRLEFTQRDVYTIGHNPQKVKRFVEIIRQRSQELL